MTRFCSNLMFCSAFVHCVFFFVRQPFLHTPLARMPLIGLQLGNLILEDEISLWKKENIEKAHQATDAVRALAQEQCDLQGRSFAGGIRDGNWIDRRAKFDSEGLRAVEPEIFNSHLMRVTSLIISLCRRCMRYDGCVLRRLKVLSVRAFFLAWPQVVCGQKVKEVYDPQ